MAFSPLDHPIVFAEPRFLSAESAWMGHIPFAFLLVDLCRPRLVMELGTHCGVSYCAFCQAVDQLKLDTRCFAIDTWKGDEHTRDYSSEILPALRTYHDPRYSSFSTLVQSTFDEALQRFADGSIDILHIDGLHTFEAVSHDFESWKSKLSKSAVVLFHDTISVTEGFGVSKLWWKLEGKYPGFEFKHSCGLGMLAVGANIPSGLSEFLQTAQANPDSMRAMFENLGRHCEMACAFHFTVWQQKIVNEWKRNIGAQVLPDSEEFSVAVSQPVIFAQNAANEVRQMAMEDLEIRKRLKG